MNPTDFRASPPTMSQQRIPLRDPWRAAFLAWLVPGLGHYYQGRKGKALLYAVCILGLYLVGFALGGGKVVYWRWVNPLNNPEKFAPHYIGQFFVGLPALPALIQGTIRHFAPDSNFLWGFMAEPPQNVLNGLILRFNRLLEVGTIYTTIAGLLNILAIYDAFEGPAYLDLDEAEAEAEAQAELAAANGVKPEGAL